MKKMNLVVLGVTVLVALAAVPVFAQTFNVRANIPFDFIAGSTAMPAGEYTFNTLPQPGAGHIQSADLHRDAVVTFEPAPLPVGSDMATVSLIFNRYDKTYFLSEVRDGYAAADCLIPPTKKELMLEKSASLHKPDEEVVVLARR
jgi:hypothetical protein